MKLMNNTDTLYSFLTTVVAKYTPPNSTNRCSNTKQQAELYLSMLVEFCNL